MVQFQLRRARRHSYRQASQGLRHRKHAAEDEAQEGDIIDDEKEEEVVAATPQKNYALK